jgi:hypothetical protein
MSSGNLDEASMNSPRKLSLSLTYEKQTTVKHSVSFVG